MFRHLLGLNLCYVAAYSVFRSLTILFAVAVLVGAAVEQFQRQRVHGRTQRLHSQTIPKGLPTFVRFRVKAHSFNDMAHRF